MKNYKLRRRCIEFPTVCVMCLNMSLLLEDVMYSSSMTLIGRLQPPIYVFNKSTRTSLVLPLPNTHYVTQLNMFHLCVDNSHLLDTAARLFLLTSPNIYETRWNFSICIYLDSIVHVECSLELNSTYPPYTTFQANDALNYLK